MIATFKDLQVYQRSYAVSLDIHRITLNFPRMEQFELGSQLRRASKSIPMNIAEGYGKRESPAEFKRFLQIAIGSCDEVRVQLEYCRDLEYLSEDDYAKYLKEYDEIGKMLHALKERWRTIS